VGRRKLRRLKKKDVAKKRMSASSLPIAHKDWSVKSCGKRGMKCGAKSASSARSDAKRKRVSQHARRTRVEAQLRWSRAERKGRSCGRRDGRRVGPARRRTCCA
jgi:hypothetical protein